VIAWIATSLAVAGCWLNNHRLRAGFLLWVAANCLSAVVHIYADMPAMWIRDAVFTALAIHGWIKWKRL
jgi:nicotinamide riboside transporter PnuC